MALLPGSMSQYQTLARLGRKFTQGRLFYVVSFPRSGRGWFRYLLANYLAELNDLTLGGGLADHNWMTSAARPDKVWEARLPDMAWKIETPVVLLTHMEYHRRAWLLYWVPLMMLMRNPYDSLVSYYHLQKDNRGYYSGSLEEYMLHPNPTSGLTRPVKWARFYNQWAPALLRHKRLLALNYERLRANPAREFTLALEFMRLPVRAEELMRTLEKSSLRRMQAVEMTPGATPNQEIKAANPQARAIRKGAIGAFREELSPELIAAIYETLDQNLTDLAKSVLNRYEVHWNPELIRPDSG